LAQIILKAVQYILLAQSILKAVQYILLAKIIIKAVQYILLAQIILKAVPTVYSVGANYSKSPTAVDLRNFICVYSVGPVTVMTFCQHVHSVLVFCA